jgi:hypothetical protein
MATYLFQINFILDFIQQTELCNILYRMLYNKPSCARFYTRCYAINRVVIVLNAHFYVFNSIIYILAKV